MDLKTEISELKGIGPKKSKAFRDAGIKTVGDLMEFFPRRYEDRRKVTPIKDVKYGQDCLVEAKVIAKRSPRGYYRKNAPLTLLISDGTGSLEVLFFNGRFLAGLFDDKTEYAFFLTLIVFPLLASILTGGIPALLLHRKEQKEREKAEKEHAKERPSWYK